MKMIFFRFRIKAGTIEREDPEVLGEYVPGGALAPWQHDWWTGTHTNTRTHTRAPAYAHAHIPNASTHIHTYTHTHMKVITLP